MILLNFIDELIFQTFLVFFYFIKALELLECRLSMEYTMIVRCLDDGMQKPWYGATLALVIYKFIFGHLKF